MFETLSFPEILILILIGLLFVKEQLVLWVSAWLGLERDYDDGQPVTTIRELAHQFSKLQEYVNHRETEFFDKLLVKIDTQIGFSEKMLEKMDRHDEMERANNAKLNEIITYGTKRRE